MFAKRESEKYACACKAYGLRLCPVANIYSVTTLAASTCFAN